MITLHRPARFESFTYARLPRADFRRDEEQYVDLTKCAQKYTRRDVETILEYSEEKHGAADPGSNTQKVKPLFAAAAGVSQPNTSLTFTTSSDKGTGHAKARHLKVNNFGLKTRTMDPASGAKSKDGMHAQGIEQASAFVDGDQGGTDLVTVITRALACKKGEEALQYMDLYKQHGKTRVVIVETAAKLSCAGMHTRVFYREGTAVADELMQSAAVIIDSNIGGKYPIKIVTAFPCKADASLELGMPDVIMQARDVHKELTDPAKAYAAACSRFLKKKHTNVDARLVRARIGKQHLVIGTPFTGSGWMKPNPVLVEVSNEGGPAQQIKPEKYYAIDTLKEIFLADGTIMWQDADNAFLIPFKTV